MAKQKSAGKFKDVPVEAQRASLQAHRAALLGDLFSAELFMERVVPGSEGEDNGKAHIEKLEAAIAATEERIAALAE